MFLHSKPSALHHICRLARSPEATHHILTTAFFSFSSSDTIQEEEEQKQEKTGSSYFRRHPKTDAYSRSYFTRLPETDVYSSSNRLQTYFQRAKLINKLLNLLCNKKPWTESVENTIKSLNPSPYVAFQVIKSPTIDPDTALSFFQSLEKNPLFSHSQKTHYVITRILVANKRVKDVEAAMKQFRHAEPSKVYEYYYHIMKGHLIGRNYEEVERTWFSVSERYLGSDKRLDIECCNVFMDSLGGSGRYGDIGVLFDEMVRSGMVPNCRTYDVIIKCLVRIGKLDVGLEVFSRLPRLGFRYSVKQLHVLVLGMCRARDYGTLVWLIEEMEREGVLPTKAVWFAFRKLRKAGFNEVVERLRTILPYEGVRSAKRNDNKDIHSDVLKKNLDQEFLETHNGKPLKHHDREFLKHTDGEFLKGEDGELLKHHDGELLKHCDRVRSSKTNENKDHVSNVSKTNDDEDFMKNHDEESLKHHDGEYLKHNSVEFLKPWMSPKALAHALSEWNYDTEDILKRENLMWDILLVCKVLESFKNVDAAWNFFHQVAKQPGFAHDVYTMTRMILILAWNGKASLVDHLMEKAVSEGIVFSSTTLSFVIGSYGKCKNADAALRIFNVARSAGLKCNDVLCSSLLNTLIKCDDGKKAIEFVKEWMAMDVTMDIQSPMRLMEYFGSVGDLSNMHLVFLLVKESGMELNAGVYKILIAANCENGAVGIAFRLYKEMRRLSFRLDDKTKKFLVDSLWEHGMLKESAYIADRKNTGAQELQENFPCNMHDMISVDLMQIHDIIMKNFI